METENSRSNIVWIDNARAISSILVIATHMLGPWVYQINQFGNVNRFFILTFFTISKLCTPTFLMISGALLIQKDYSDLTQHKRRVKRLFSSFVLWSLLYLIFYTFLNIYKGEHYTLKSYALFLKESALQGSAYHLWFMYLIIGIYLSMPLLSILCKKISKNQLIIFFVIWGITLITNLFVEFNSIGDFISSCIGYLGYLFVGSLINKNKLNEKIRIRYASIIFLVGVVSTLYLAYHQFSETQAVSAKTFHRLNVNIAFVTIGFFMMIKSYMYKNEFIKSISKHSLGIYYIHLFLIMIVNKIWILNVSDFILFKLVISSVIILLTSYVLIKYIEKKTSNSKWFNQLIIN